MYGRRLLQEPCESEQHNYQRFLFSSGRIYRIPTRSVVCQGSSESVPGYPLVRLSTNLRQREGSINGSPSISLSHDQIVFSMKT